MKHKNFRKLFTIYFITFGILISLMGASINYYIQTMQANKILSQKASEVFQIRNENELKYYLNHLDNTLKSIKNSRLMQDFISSKNLYNKEKINDLFLSTSNANELIMRIRYIDKNGKEVILVDKNNSKNNSFAENDSNLKDQKESDYFKKISKLDNSNIWYSKLKLVTTNQEIEKPYKPTFIIGTPLFNKNNFDGILVINIFLNDLLKMVANSTIFNHYIIDKDNNYIFHPNEEFSFSSYKNIKRDIKEDFPNGLNDSEVFTYSLENIFKNEENLLMVIKAKDNYKNEIFLDKLKTLVLLLFITLFLSFIMAVMMSNTPIMLERELFKAHEDLNEFKEIINKYVITYSAKNDGTIIESSEAFEKVSGYSKEELIGNKISIIKHPTEDKETIKNLLNTIRKNQIWIGIIKNKTKDGREFWLEQTIIPKIDEKNHSLKKYLSVSIDITDKKLLEEMASIDKLTGIYNRRMLDEFLQKTIDVVSRHNEELSLIIIDIDYFKNVNDTYGHVEGDNVLFQVSKIISENLRSSDIFGRYGGEEFLIICTKTDKNSAFILAEKLRNAIKNHEFPNVGEKTISLGIAEFEKNDKVKSLLEKADLALYKAKNNGRNKTIIYEKEIKSLDKNSNFYYI